MSLGTKTKRAAKTAKDKSYPKTTRAAAADRRLPVEEGKVEKRLKRKFDAQPDRIDIRDRWYNPSLSPLPDQVINCDSVPVILDQGAEGACTGFALAAVINYQLAARNLITAENSDRKASPRMIYEMARRYDEWPGEKYEGSSARGAMKGWIAHGVCSQISWPDTLRGHENFTPEMASQALQTPGGAYYRVKHREIRDMHAAIYEAGIIYCTLMVHDGWGEPRLQKEPVVHVDRFGNIRHRKFPVIERPDDKDAEDGHAIAIVGYTRDGFIIQNSWGTRWGEQGFALLPYDDYMMNATDVWVAQLGVPVRLDGWQKGRNKIGASRASSVIPLNDIRPYAMDVGNNGELSSSGKYWTTEEDLKYLFQQIEERSQKEKWEKKRLLLYLHGGLNSEEAVARRVIAFRDVLLENEIYPLHIMWETGFMESLKSMVEDYFTDTDPRAGGVADWLSKFREGLIEAKDRSFELTVSKPGTALWNEMKQNARLSSEHPDGKGGMQLLAKYAKEAIKEGSKQAGRDVSKDWELHVVAHSAGSIYAAYAMRHLVNSGVAFKSLHLMAPAITLDLFKKTVWPLIKSGKCPQPSLYILSDVGERDDNVKLYGKSLLYLVSNGFEGKRETPLLGMERFVSDERGSEKVDKDMLAFFKKRVESGLPSLVIAGKAGGPESTSRSDSHGGFDNDEWTLNSILWRVLGKKPKREFDLRDLQY